MKYIVEVRKAKQGEEYLDVQLQEDYSATTYPNVAMSDFRTSEYPVILATIPAQDFDLVIATLENNLADIGSRLSEVEPERYEALAKGYDIKISQLQSAISILRTLSVNKNEGEE